ncbi:MAG: 1-phosphofructokinase, partial [Trichococcus flocculiformis]
GKGINVSRILNELEVENTALGFLGGFTGKYIEDWLEAENSKTHFTHVDEATRINVKIKSGMETEMNGPGPNIEPAVAEEFLKQFDALDPENDIVVLAGSKPTSLPEDYYQTIIHRLTEKGVPFLIDTTGEELKNALPYHPLLVKPNHHELAELFDTTFETDEDILPYGKKLLEAGAQYAIISMAAKGAILFTPEGVYHGTVPKGVLKNSVGSGDSMIAGFVGTYMKTHDPLEAFKVSIACGSATAFADDLAKREEIDALVKQVTISQL